MRALSPLAGLFPDWIFARKAYIELNAYMDTRVDRTLALSKEELLKKEQKMNLMETLAVKQPDRKVRICAAYGIPNAETDISLQSTSRTSSSPYSLRARWAALCLSKEKYAHN